MKNLLTAMLVIIFPVLLMAGTNFPTAIDTLADKTSSDVITSAGWNTIQDAIEALETKVGIDDSADATSLDYDMVAVETTLGQVVTTLGVVNVKVNGMQLGYAQRPKFSCTDDDTISIGPGVYHHSGTTNQLVYWDSTLSKDVTVSGPQFYYLYIDDSAIVTLGSNELTADELVMSTTGPSWSDPKHGWYNGLDRCIMAFYVAASDNLLTILHDGGNYVHYGDTITDRNIASSITDAETISIHVPSFCTKANLHFGGTFPSALYAGPSSDGAHTLWRGAGAATSNVTTEIYLNASQQLYVWMGSYSGALLHIDTNGWYFPVGM